MSQAPPPEERSAAALPVAIHENPWPYVSQRAHERERKETPEDQRRAAHLGNLGHVGLRGAGRHRDIVPAMSHRAGELLAALDSSGTSGSSKRKVRQSALMPISPARRRPTQSPGRTTA